MTNTVLTDGSFADDDAAPAIARVVRVEEDDPVAKHIRTMYLHYASGRSHEMVSGGGRGSCFSLTAD